MVFFRVVVVWLKFLVVVWVGGWVIGRLVDVGVLWGWVVVGEGVIKVCFIDCVVWEIMLLRDWSMEGDWVLLLWKVFGLFIVVEGFVGWLWVFFCNFCVVIVVFLDKVLCILLMFCCRVDLLLCNWVLVFLVCCCVCFLVVLEIFCVLVVVWLVVRFNCWVVFCFVVFM